MQARKAGSLGGVQLEGNGAPPRGHTAVRACVRAFWVIIGGRQAHWWQALTLTRTSGAMFSLPSLSVLAL